MIISNLNLQLFADGGDGSSSSEGTAVTSQVADGNIGVEQNPTADGEATAPRETPVPAESFDDLIKGKYKADYDARIKDTINRRFKANEQRFSKLEPIISELGKKYGVDVSDMEHLDVDTLASALYADNAQFEDEALAAGIPVDTYREMKKIEHQNAMLQDKITRQQEEEQNRQEWAQIVKASEGVKEIYPSFDLQAEMDNPNFGRLVANGVDPRTAYEVVHRDQIQPAAMQFAAQKTAEQISASIQAGKNRPVENGVGIGAGASVSTKLDPANMSREERNRIRQRVLERGERISF